MTFFELNLLPYIANDVTVGDKTIIYKTSVHYLIFDTILSWFDCIDLALALCSVVLQTLNVLFCTFALF